MAKNGNGISKNADRKYLLLAFRIIGDFGATISIPVIFFVYLGQRLDDHYRHTATFTIVGFILASCISAILVYRKAKRYGEEYRDIEKKP